eukprot:887500-Prymnesium_polylepis.1
MPSRRAPAAEHTRTKITHRPSTRDTQQRNARTPRGSAWTQHAARPLASGSRGGREVEACGSRLRCAERGVRRRRCQSAARVRRRQRAGRGGGGGAPGPIVASRD